MKHGGSFHSYVKLPEGKLDGGMRQSLCLVLKILANEREKGCESLFLDSLNGTHEAMAIFFIPMNPP